MNFDEYLMKTLEDEELRKEYESLEIEYTMIKAANKANLTGQQLIDTNTEEGLLGVYNLGMQHMYEYLKGE